MFMYCCSDSCLCSLISSLNFFMNASTRRFSSSCPGDASLRPRTIRPCAGIAAQPSLKVSDFHIPAAGFAASFSRTTRVSHVSAFLRWRASGALPSVIARHVVSSVSSLLGLATLLSALSARVLVLPSYPYDKNM